MKVPEGVKLAVGFLLMGYAGFQFAGWPGAILLPIGVFIGMAVLVSPLLVLFVVAGVFIRSIEAYRSANVYVRGAFDR